MALCGLFSSALALLNGVGVSTGEALAAHVNTWLDRKGRGFPILPLLTACSRCLASVRHMTRIVEACITAHFNHGEHVNPSACVNTSVPIPNVSMFLVSVLPYVSRLQRGLRFCCLCAIS